MTAYNIKQGARGGGEPPGACDGSEPLHPEPPCSNEKVLRHYIFAMLFAVLKDMACKLLTDAASRRPLNRLAITIAES